MLMILVLGPHKTLEGTFTVLDFPMLKILLRCNVMEHMNEDQAIK